MFHVSYSRPSLQMSLALLFSQANKEDDEQRHTTFSSNIYLHLQSSFNSPSLQRQTQAKLYHCGLKPASSYKARTNFKFHNDLQLMSHTPQWPSPLPLAALKLSDISVSVDADSSRIVLESYQLFSLHHPRNASATDSSLSVLSAHWDANLNIIRKHVRYHFSTFFSLFHSLPLSH